MEGVDYSFTRPNAFCLYGKGKRFAGRYFGPGSQAKHATHEECALLAAAGLSIVSLVEGAERSAMYGHSMGVTHARMADAAAQSAGMPKTRPLYASIDWDASSTELVTVGEYLDGFASVVGRQRTGVYGGIRTVQWCHDHGKAKWYFQTYAWSHGTWYPRAHLRQYRNGQSVCGGDVDLCQSIKADFGGWVPGRETIGDAPGTGGVENPDTPWEFGDLVDALAGHMGDVASAVAMATVIIEGLE